MKRLALLLAVVLLLPALPAFGGDKGLTNTETFSGFQFNFNNPGARALGMGGAFVAVADDATAVIANPAGLVILQRPELSAEVKFTRFTNTVEAFSNTPDQGAAGARSKDFSDSVITPSFFSFVYPTERLVVAAFIRELINYESSFETQGVFLQPGTSRLSPVRSDLEIKALNFGLGAGINLEKEHPLLPNIGASLEFSIGRIRSRLDRFGTQGATGPPDFNNLVSSETVDGTDVGIGFNIGALWHPMKDMGVGIVYRRGPRFDTDLELNIGGASTSVDFGFKVPDVAAAGISYRFFERLTIGFEATFIQYSQLVKNFQVLLGQTNPRKYKVDDAVELHLGAEYIFFVKDIPMAARVGAYTNPDHKIRYIKKPSNIDEVGERLLYSGGHDRVNATAGFGVVPFPGFQLDFAGNYSKDIREFSVSTVFRF